MPADYELVLANSGKHLAWASLADSWTKRMVGLLRHDSLGPDEALFFPGCHSIHTFGMRFTIDAIFIDRAWRIVALRPGLAPGKIVLPILGAWGVIEVAEDFIAHQGLKKDDLLELVKVLNGSQKNLSKVV